MPQEFEKLTNRQREVLRFLTEGLCNPEIAVRLDITVKTVEYHVGNILVKLDARSRTEAVVKALEAGLVWF